MFGLHSTRCSTIMTYPRSRDKSLRRSAIFCADGIRAMPSARALLVASLLTEPPYGCLGPSGNDRYRKRSLRSQTLRGFASLLPTSRRIFRNRSATDRCQALSDDPPQWPALHSFKITADTETL